jgi:hypothetical protein
MVDGVTPRHPSPAVARKLFFKIRPLGPVRATAPPKWPFWTAKKSPKKLFWRRGRTNLFFSWHPEIGNLVAWWRVLRFYHFKIYKLCR